MKTKYFFGLLLMFISGCNPSSTTLSATPSNEPLPSIADTTAPTATLRPSATYTSVPTIIPARLDIPLPNGVDWYWQNDISVMHFCFPYLSITEIQDFYNKNMGGFNWKEAGYGCKRGVFSFPSDFTSMGGWVKVDESEEADFFYKSNLDRSSACLYIQFIKCP